MDPRSTGSDRCPENRTIQQVERETDRKAGQSRLDRNEMAIEGRPDAGAPLAQGEGEANP